VTFNPTFSLTNRCQDWIEAIVRDKERENDEEKEKRKKECEREKRHREDEWQILYFSHSSRNSQGIRSVTLMEILFRRSSLLCLALCI
jgi:hypothetical protein